MNKITFEQVLISPIVQIMESYSCLKKVSQLNRKIFYVVLQYLNSTKIFYLKSQVLAERFFFHFHLNHLKNKGIFFAIHWTGLLLYASTLDKYSKKGRRGHCICKVIDELRTKGLRAKYALLLIKEILALGQISRVDQRLALHWNTARDEHLSNNSEREIAFLLLRTGNIKDKDEMILFSLIEAIKKKDVELVRAFLYGVSNWSERSLQMACNEAKDKNVSILLHAHRETFLKENMDDTACNIL